MPGANAYRTRALRLDYAARERLRTRALRQDYTARERLRHVSAARLDYAATNTYGAGV